MFVIVKMSYTDWTVFNAESGSTDTSEVVTGLSLGSKYVFDISAVNDSGSGSTVETGQISLTPQSVPSSASFPTNFSAQSYQDSKSTLTWTHSANTSTEGVYGYKIEYKQNYTGTYQTATENTGLVTTYEITGLTNTGAYFFKISPVNEAGVSTSGVESSTTTFTGAQATGVGDTSYNVVSGGKSYKVHKFTQAGSLTIQGNLLNPEILIVAGGGGGGMDMGGGGGGGGVIAGSVSSLLAGTYNVIVGLGGDGAPKPESGSTEKRQRDNHPFSYPAKNGQNSSFGDFVGYTSIPWAHYGSLESSGVDLAPKKIQFYRNLFFYMAKKDENVARNQGICLKSIRSVFEFYKNNPEASMQIQAPLFEDKVIDNF